MFGVLEPLHSMMEKGPETLKEISFNHVCYGCTLSSSVYVGGWGKGRGGGGD